MLDMEIVFELILAAVCRLT